MTKQPDPPRDGGAGPVLRASNRQAPQGAPRPPPASAPAAKHPRVTSAHADHSASPVNRRFAIVAEHSFSRCHTTEMKLPGRGDARTPPDIRTRLPSPGSWAHQPKPHRINHFRRGVRCVAALAFRGFVWPAELSWRPTGPRQIRYGNNSPRALPRSRSAPLISRRLLPCTPLTPPAWANGRQITGKAPPPDTLKRVCEQRKQLHRNAIRDTIDAQTSTRDDTREGPTP